MQILIVRQTPDGLEKIVFEAESGSTVGSALKQNDIVVSEKESVTVWDQKCTSETVLKAGDRIEICLPLLIDPKEARRLRAAVKSEGMLRKRRHAKG